MNENEKEEQELWQQAAKAKGEERVDALLKLSYTAFGKGNHEECLALCETAKEEYEALGAAGSSTTMAHIYYGIAWSLHSLEKTDQAIEAMDKSLSLYREVGSAEQVVNALKSEGDFWFKAKEYQKAFDSYQMILLEPFPDIAEINIAWSLDYSGQAAQKLKRWDLAIQNFKRAREVLKKLKKLALIAHIDEEISFCYSMLSEGIEAEHYANRVMDYALISEDEFHLIWGKARLGVAMRVQGKLDEAMKLVTEAKSTLVHSDDFEWKQVLELETERLLIFTMQGNDEEVVELTRRIASLSETVLQDGEEL